MDSKNNTLFRAVSVVVPATMELKSLLSFAAFGLSMVEGGRGFTDVWQTRRSYCPGIRQALERLMGWCRTLP